MWLFLPNRQIQLCWSSQSNSFLLSFIKVLGLKKPEWLLPATLFSNALWNTVLPLLFCGSSHSCLWKVYFGWLQRTKSLIYIVVSFCLFKWRILNRLGGFSSAVWSGGYFLNMFSKRVLHCWRDFITELQLSLGQVPVSLKLTKSSSSYLHF